MSELSLTPKQQTVLEELRRIGTNNADAYRTSCTYLYQEDCLKLTKGDAHCVFGLGGLTWQVGGRLSMSTASVLNIFKALEAKGLVIREARNMTYQRPLYWWPVGLADALCDALARG